MIKDGSITIPDTNLPEEVKFMRIPYGEIKGDITNAFNNIYSPRELEEKANAYTKLLRASKIFGGDTAKAKVELLKFGRDVFTSMVKADRAYRLIGDICSKLTKAELKVGPPKIEEGEFMMLGGEEIKKAVEEQGLKLDGFDYDDMYVTFPDSRNIRGRLSLPDAPLSKVFVNFQNKDVGVLILENPGNEFPINRKFYTEDLDPEDEEKIRQIMTEAGFQGK